MSRKEKELENPDGWDFESAEAKRPVKARRAVVSVALSAEDFERVAEAAERSHLTISGFIREAALEKTGRSGGTAHLYFAGGGGPSAFVSILASSLLPTTSASAPEREDVVVVSGR